MRSLVTGWSPSAAGAYQNAWRDYPPTYGPVTVWKDPNGFVTMQGLTYKTNSTGFVSAEVIFVVPPAFRPSQAAVFASAAYGTAPGYAEVRVDGAGEVFANEAFPSGNLGWLSLNNIHYLADNG